PILISRPLCCVAVRPAFASTVTAPTEIYTLSLHDALPISFGATPRQPLYGISREAGSSICIGSSDEAGSRHLAAGLGYALRADRSEEHTSELQSRENLVCRLLLEKKNRTVEQVDWNRVTWT